MQPVEAGNLIDLSPLASRLDAMSAKLTQALYLRGFLDGAIVAGLCLVVLFLLCSPRPSK